MNGNAFGSFMGGLGSGYSTGRGIAGMRQEPVVEPQGAVPQQAASDPVVQETAQALQQQDQAAQQSQFKPQQPAQKGKGLPDMLLQLASSAMAGGGDGAAPAAPAAPATGKSSDPWSALASIIMGSAR